MENTQAPKTTTCNIRNKRRLKNPPKPKPHEQPPPWMRRIRAQHREIPKRCHRKKKDGKTCRADCKVCEKINFDMQQLNDPNAVVLHEYYLVREKGPKGSPTKDKSGRELDYDDVSKPLRPGALRTRKPP